jgi:hypothetical protein
MHIVTGRRRYCPMKTYEEPKIQVIEFETPEIMTLTVSTGILDDGKEWGPLI